METVHRTVQGDARQLGLPDESVELVVTSPPYPMIELWDELFASLDPAIGTAIERENGAEAFEAMHAQLASVWSELARVLVDGGIACINIGDATRSINGQYQLYPNHSRVIEAFTQRGFAPLPSILWHKPTNAATKFLGSGMTPPNAYVTLEHEYILLFRKGSRRSFPPGASRRYEAAYFWEERNRWFSEIWSDITGDRQALDNEQLRDRSAAYPFAIPYRLINMFSVYGDTVFDPFWGTGTTTAAAMASARHSIGYELSQELIKQFETQHKAIPEQAAKTAEERLEAHQQFVQESPADDHPYVAEKYDLPVRTKQERDLTLYTIDQIKRTTSGYRVAHTPYSQESAGEN